MPAAIDGLWQYVTLTRPGGTPMPLDGVLLIAGGCFLQHSVDAGEPLEAQLAQGHYGPATLTPDGVLSMTATTGFLVYPMADGTRFVNREGTHRADARVDGDTLTLTFETGTVQLLSRAGGIARITPLSGGAFARIGERFVLVHAAGSRAVTAAGTSRGDGRGPAMRATRWVSFVDGTATYARELAVELDESASGLSVAGYGAIPLAGA